MTDPSALADPASPRRPRIPRLLRQAAFRRYWSAQTVSLFGDQITILAVPLLAVLAIGAGPAEVGYLTAASLLPNLFFSLPAALVADALTYLVSAVFLSRTRVPDIPVKSGRGLGMASGVRYVVHSAR